jgi:exopolyphosphatase/guanosine-5'-triphosphate,3'-diphosphate pyrophosphatase
VTLRARPVAALDVGSNTIRLLVAGREDGGLKTELDLSDFARLGMGVAETHELEPARMERALKTIRQYVTAARDAGAREIAAVATSAVREAANGPAFVDRVRREAGIDLEIISGEREAELTYLGATCELPVAEPVVVADVGGGSAEVIAAGSDGMCWGEALPLGSGRMTERFIHHDPPTTQEMDGLNQHVCEILRALPSFAAGRAIFTGGSSRYMSKLLGLTQPATISPTQLAEAGQVLQSKSVAEVVEEYGVPLERAQVLPGGVGVLAGIATFYEVDTVTIARGGIREGMVVDLLRKREGGP